MQYHNVQPTHSRKSKKRLGRGQTSGNYCGRGVKGQKARSNTHFQPFIREVIKRYPKMRGYRASRSPVKYSIINVADLEKLYNANEEISPDSLAQKKIIPSNVLVKILGNGTLVKKLSIKGCAVSAVAKQKIEAAKGTIS